uniref:G-type lectin S-receptor-like serine/threonine-protein kinase CES101 n=1 Tax=Erigeron canadensis TaxID=72917 RepID=UPI001CB92F19|nr:G-type lectin S-receptor-like serine/threonine-protein kinase CES101 [Erigeron canadensis]
MINTIIIFTFLCANLIINILPAGGVSTIKVGESLNATSRLVSPSKNFTLGFFTIPATSHTYLGIWYTNDDKTAKVWVANPSTPIVSGVDHVFMINANSGKLTIASEGTTLVNISDNQIGQGPHLTANLEDNGNFQLKNETDNMTLWQSFDHPTNVLLPGMKLGSDLRTGQKWELTSWLSDEIPDQGAFTLSWQATEKASQRMMIRRRGQPYWSSGDLDNETCPYLALFNGPDSLYHYNLTYVYNNEERYFSYNILETVSNAQAMWYLTPRGEIMDGYMNINMYWTPELCYGFDSGNGCMDDPISPWCRSEHDKFSKLNGYFAPGAIRVYDFNTSLSISDCMVRCWNNCNCVGFASAHINETGCSIWTGNKSASKFITDPQERFGLTYVLISLNPHKDITIIWAPAVAGFLLLFFCFGLVWYLKKRKHRREEERQKRDEKYLLQLMASESFDSSNNHENNGRKGSDLIVFGFASIAAATNDFANENKLGQGGFGPVYKGKLSDGREIAVKRLSKTSGQGLLEFKNELVLIANLQHTTLVRVLGCCIRGEEKLLIYEYMPNKSLDFFLFDETKKVLLDWRKRWIIIEGIAQGLLYLHKYSRMTVIHRDLKASNVLLDESMNPKISDFGIARIFKQNETKVMTKKVVGTYGYMSPEYALEGTFSVKSDVFSFGVIILEIVTGRRNTTFSHLDKSVNLIGYAWELWQQGDALELADPTIADTCVVQQLLRSIHIALLCVQENALDRPVMSEVMSMLTNDTMTLLDPKCPAFFFGRTTSNSAELESKDCSVSSTTITKMEGR